MDLIETINNITRDPYFQYSLVGVYFIILAPFAWSVYTHAKRLEDQCKLIKKDSISASH